MIERSDALESAEPFGIGSWHRQYGRRSGVLPRERESGFVSAEGNPREDGEDLTPLLSAAAGGDEHAWRRLVELYSRRVYAMARSRCRSAAEAEEITQSVFATVAIKMGRREYEEQGRFESWLFRIVMNRVRDHVRQMRRRLDTPNSDILETSIVDPGARRDEGELARLKEALERLSDADREVIEMRHHGGMSFKAMAEVLEEPIGTLLARHHRALRKLRELMESETPASRGEAAS
jgi:RNA polymerase sigma-70 factor (ECF subfamily)